jgi:phosphoinositide-3-kinase, regulatory subunit 4
LFENLPCVCRMVGRAATEEFVLPCIEIGLVDREDQVIRHALACLCRLIEVGLLSRAILLGGANRPYNQHNSSSLATTSTQSLLEMYSAFLIHPSEGIRHGAMETFATACRAAGSPDLFVYIVPIMRPFLRFQPTLKHMMNESEMERCLQPAWTRKRFDQELAKVLNSSASPKSPTSQAGGTWMTVGIRVARDGGIEAGGETATAGGGGANAATGPAKVPGVSDDPQLNRVVGYLRMYSRHLTHSSIQEQYVTVSAGPTRAPRTGLASGLEGSIRLAQSIMFPRQDGKGIRNSLPEWYNSLREQAETSDSVVSEASAIRSLSALGMVYGLSIMGPPTEGTKENIVPAVHAQDVEPGRTLLDSDEAMLIEAASLGEWGSEAILDPDVVDTSLLVTKLRALDIPTLPPRLCDQVVNRPGTMTGNVPAQMVDWRPRMNTLIASSSPISGHTAPVVRLAVSLDNSFFVSGSHDGTCAVWEIPQLEDSVGILDSSIIYSGHSEHGPTRINDVAMVEGTHSVASGASNGSVHVWRVDLVSSSSTSSKATHGRGSGSGRERSRVVGASSVKNIYPGEGEVLAVSNFSSMSSSVVVFATQKGVVHGWDLRCAQEPFKLQHGPDLGHLSTMALGNDRQWLVTGTSRGYLALWDIRFQQAAKLYRHSSGAKICRAATSFVPPPQNWGMKASHVAPRPFVFLGTTSNECGMFDIMDGSCRECFRTVSDDGLDSSLETQELPSLLSVPISPRFRNGALSARADHQQHHQQPPYVTPSTSINCMVGSVGGRGQCFLLTGGSDGRVRFWDFASPSRCYIAAGGGLDLLASSSLQSNTFRPSFERVDFDDGPAATAARRLMICRQPFIPVPSSRRRQRLPSMSKSADHYHTDSIQDLKIIDSKALISCSRDCTVKVWR